MILKGLLVVIIITSLVILISMILRNSKTALITCLSILWILTRLRYTTNLKQLIPNPLYYAKMDIQNTVYYFIGDFVTPYILAFIPLAVLYLLILKFLIRRQYKKYKLS
ncbi:MAG: hypothetical protein ATN31_05695 [Candidatus Epulonipiscioides saccharophilum]|nr:MAG: hypothetical protein ATN31_05695 [Epulopiscium sp. AS2M-Bin001]